MKAINIEYERIIKDSNFDFNETTQEEKNDFIKYPEIINKIIALNGLIIEIIGDWIWVSGNTYVHKQILKELGLFFASKKLMWYYRPEAYKSDNFKPMAIDDIRKKYGSKIIENNHKFDLLLK